MRWLVFYCAYYNKSSEIDAFYLCIVRYSLITTENTDKDKEKKWYHSSEVTIVNTSVQLHLSIHILYLQDL